MQAIITEKGIAEKTITLFRFEKFKDPKFYLPLSIIGLAMIATAKFSSMLRDPMCMVQVVSLVANGIISIDFVR